MHWEWIVPVIALALWIISSLVKTAEDRSKQAGPGEPLPPDSPPRPLSEVDRFLEEINRMRRRQDEEQRQETPPQRREPLATPPSPVVVRQVEPTTAPNFEKPVVVEEKPRPRTIIRHRRPEPRPTQFKPSAPVPAAPPLPPPPPSVPPARPYSPAVAQLQALLRSTQSLQTAILLQEVLGPPKCRRRR
jgi:hypothetical protein